MVCLVGIGSNELSYLCIVRQCLSNSQNLEATWISLNHQIWSWREIEGVPARKLDSACARRQCSNCFDGTVLAHVPRRDFAGARHVSKQQHLRPVSFCLFLVPGQFVIQIHKLALDLRWSFTPSDTSWKSQGSTFTLVLAKGPITAQQWVCFSCVVRSTDSGLCPWCKQYIISIESLQNSILEKI